ncbi:MAG: sulfopyruvate decarboxylase subunit beta [Chloroflexi bacterium]|nr:sulfopyruvate decarboxylase subunit beta [Chloroflexota bacterium]
MNRFDCLKFLAEHHTDELVVCTLGETSSAWWEVNPRRDEDTFYMRSSMGMVSSMALGLALALPHRKIWALDGDGALAMNLSTLLTTSQVQPKNLLHLVWLNHAFGATGHQPLWLPQGADFASLARAAGIEEAHTFRTLEEFTAGMLPLLHRAGHIFVVAEVERSERRADRSPRFPIDMAYRFGRFIEQSEGIRVFEA